MGPYDNGFNNGFSPPPTAGQIGVQQGPGQIGFSDRNNQSGFTVPGTSLGPNIQPQQPGAVNSGTPWDYSKNTTNAMFGVYDSPGGENIGDWRSVINKLYGPGDPVQLIQKTMGNNPNALANMQRAWGAAGMDPYTATQLTQSFGSGAEAEQSANRMGMGRQFTAGGQWGLRGNGGQTIGGTTTTPSTNRTGYGVDSAVSPFNPPNVGVGFSSGIPRRTIQPIVARNPANIAHRYGAGGRFNTTFTNQ